jgi:superfamily II RNA helicase
MNNNSLKQYELRKAYKENKGNWEYNLYQKVFDPNHESKVKKSLEQKNIFNPRNIYQYIIPEISKEDRIVIKKSEGDQLTKTEEIIYNNYMKKNEDALSNDISMIKTLGFTAKPVTKEGKIRFLLYTLERMLEDNNTDYIANIYLRLMEEQFQLSLKLRKEYKNILDRMNKIVEKLDIIELQFTKFYQQMPPLNQNTFHKFDDWQVQVIDNIHNNISTIVRAPTSAGKTVISGYATLCSSNMKGKTLFVVPTDALTWQVASYVETIINSHVPIITETYQSNPSRDKMINLLNNAECIVGTPENIVDYLPFIKNNFKWLIFDEIHMIGKKEGKAMEYIIKVLPNIPILGLSATIGNINEVVDWLKKISPNNNITEVTCDKRFFNLMKYYYDNNTNSLEQINPLAMVDESEFMDKSILKKDLAPTPLDTWNLMKKLSSKFDLKGLNYNVYFNRNKRIELNDSIVYFNKLIEFMVNNNNLVKDILQSYKFMQNNLESKSLEKINFEEINFEEINLPKLIFKMKSENKTPAIIFQKNTSECLKISRKFAKDIYTLENEKYPKLEQERLKIEKLAKKQEKKIEKNTDSTNDSKTLKQMMGKLKLKKDGYGENSIKSIPIEESINIIPIQSPHPEFNFNPNQYFTEDNIKEWSDSLKKYFPMNGTNYHYIIKLLWRGVGIYAKGLPDPYLRLVQSLACTKQLAVVFSDISLVFGVSMPFRSVVILNGEKDDLDSMLYHQMSGRAGRRGLDKEGNIIFAGYSFNRIKELSNGNIPIIEGYY